MSSRSMRSTARAAGRWPGSRSRRTPGSRCCPRSARSRSSSDRGSANRSSPSRGSTHLSNGPPQGPSTRCKPTHWAWSKPAEGNYPVAVSLYERAVQIDPQFAVADQALAREQTNSGYSQEAVFTAATRAIDLRARTTEEERFSIAALDYLSVTGDLERAIEVAERWKTTYPLSNGARTTSSEISTTPRRSTRRPSTRHARPCASTPISPPPIRTWRDRCRARSFQRSSNGLSAGHGPGPRCARVSRVLWRIAYFLGDSALRTGARLGGRQLDVGFNMASLSAALQGRWQESLRASQRSSEFFDARDQKRYSMLAARYDAVTGALDGDCATSRERAQRALRPVQPAEDQARAIVAFAMCGETDRTSGVAARLKDRHPQNTMLNRVWLPLIRPPRPSSKNRPRPSRRACRRRL